MIHKLNNSHDALQLLISLDIIKSGEIDDLNLRIFINEFFKYIGVSDDEIRDYLRSMIA